MGFLPDEKVTHTATNTPLTLSSTNFSVLNLFQLGNFTLHAGGESFFKIDCDALSDGSWQTIAKMIAVAVGPFSSVEGIPRGGLKLAKALEQYRATSNAFAHLVVDDVYTTGKSMTARLEAFSKDHPMKEVIGAVAFARGNRPRWITAICQLPSCFWPYSKGT